ncbi:hypothetical protein AGLY_002482 [Aphis glycines]|uniref:Uncharacterized protein n=1 Tax=Aphis glycines TaxID=307491 RepID=A0A6G0U0D0_APHGL|nr:hypothetical protein AGLY_002482 [Aphis glycines]
MKYPFTFIKKRFNHFILKLPISEKVTKKKKNEKCCIIYEITKKYMNSQIFIKQSKLLCEILNSKSHIILRIDMVNLFAFAFCTISAIVMHIYHSVMYIAYINVKFKVIINERKKIIVIQYYAKNSWIKYSYNLSLSSTVMSFPLIIQFRKYGDNDDFKIITYTFYTSLSSKEFNITIKLLIVTNKNKI